MGLGDSTIYIKMSRNERTDSSLHAYRFIIPKIVSIIRPYGKFLPKREHFESKEIFEDKSLFYLVNFTIATITSFIFFYYLKAIGLNYIGSFIGTLLFISNRVIIYSVGSALVDSIQYLSLILICYSIVTNKVKLLTLLNPILILTKETIIPLTLLPILKKSFWKKSYLLSILISFIFLIFVRSYISNDIISNFGDSSNESMLDNIFYSMLLLPERIRGLFTITGFHDYFSTFTILFFTAIAGARLNSIKKEIVLPKQIILLLPYSIILMILSGNFGRILILSYPIVIPYSVIFILNLFNQTNHKL
tara:strand:+ start:374 stop:1291 length:918 start_codon:yes stop_codon:yes gene_type:complete